MVPHPRPFRSSALVVAFAMLATLLCACVAQTPPGGGPPPPGGDPFGRSINFGNALEAPNEGDWGLTILESHVQAVADAGFETVRLPVKWSAHAAQTAPYTIDPAFLARVDEVVAWILDRDLKVIVDFHHYDEMSSDPGAHVQRWLAIWEQIALHYRDAPPELAFELLNEPNQALSDALWNPMVAQVLSVIRQSNPTRWVVVGPTDWNAIGALGGLVLPDDDHLVLTVHFYDPFEFTHQGAEWVDSPPPTGRAWTGTQLSPAGGWADWSWGTQRVYGEELTVTFEEGWAGLYLRAGQPVSGYEQLALALSGGLSLSVYCGGDDDEPFAFPTKPGALSFIDLADCGDGVSVQQLILQNATADAQPSFVVETLALEGPAGRLELLTSEAEAVAAAMDQVLAWAQDHGGLPVLLGEFGAYGTADMDSRVRWTRAVRQAAEARGFGWAYWEFGAGFGVYDPVAEAWRPELLDALMGE